jgi:uncharacterized SAM-dependent methyltransferase
MNQLPAADAPVLDGSRSSGQSLHPGLLHTGHRNLIHSLLAVLDETHFPWPLVLVGEDQAAKLALLTGDLRRPESSTGDGKRITSGFSYLGAEPAIAWVTACSDRLYPVMRESIESFGQRWHEVRPALGRGPYHYVSLGPGDGQKDAVILRDLRRDNPRLSYIAVDMSSEMLRLGVGDVVRQLELSRNCILPVQLDFSAPDNVARLRHLLDKVFGAEPILFSLLGNTVANFEDDAHLLRLLSRTLLRPHDRLALEVATTERLGADLAEEAASEYGRSRTFREFVTSALMHYTDLQIDMDSVLFAGNMVGQRALMVKIIYANTSGRATRITLPDRTTVRFPYNDTILLLLTRKYAPDGLDALLAESRVSKVAGSHFYFAGRTGSRFGMDLLILAGSPQTIIPEENVAQDIWRE